MAALRWLIVVAALWWALSSLLAWRCSDRLIFRPPPAGYRDGPAILKLATASGARISAIFLTHAASPFTILYSHGNAEDLGTVVHKAALLRDLGYSVLCYDYEGYGTSEGRPSEAAVYRGADAAYDHLTRERGIPPGRIVAYGMSLGGGAAADLAARKPVAGLVLESTFVSAYRVITRVPLFPGDKFRNLSKLARVRCPVLVMHGGADEVIAQWHGRALHDRANGPKRALWVEGAGHGDLPLVAGERYAGALRDFAALLERR